MSLGKLSNLSSPYPLVGEGASLYSPQGAGPHTNSTTPNAQQVLSQYCYACDGVHFLRAPPGLCPVLLSHAAQTHDPSLPRATQGPSFSSHGDPII